MEGIEIAIQSETELYSPVKQYFEKLGYEVRGEVNGCDLVAMHEKEPEPVIVELKKSFNLSLLFQGLQRLKLSSQVYLAVEQIRGKKRPHQQKWGDVQQLCERIGFGLITVQFYKTKEPFVEVWCKPVPNDMSGKSYKSDLKSSKKTMRLIHEFRERSGDYNVGGSTRQKLMTAYRELALQCAQWIHRQGPLSPSQLRELTGKQKVASILQNNYYGWFTRVKRGIYDLTPEGQEALNDFSQRMNGNY